MEEQEYENSTLEYGSTTSKPFKIPEEYMTFNMLLLLCSLLATYLWIVYITFYNSRVVGYCITKLVNRLFIKSAYFKLGSLTINPLAGKIMFRDVVYINYDYTYRIQDGYVIFRWWRSYVPKDVSDSRTDLSHSDTRLSVMLNGFELHIYNRSDLYAEVEKAFGLKPSLLIPSETMSAEELAKIKEHALNLENQKFSKNDKIKKKRPEAMTATTWRDLIPVIKLDICSGRFVFGNRLTPTTLSICVEEAHCVYSTKPAVSRLDHFMHFVKAKVENAKVLLAPSPKFTGMVDDPPRYMGEGFVVMMSNLLELYFYMDEAGVVPEEPVLLTLANGDVVESAPPVWGIDIKCGKGNSNFSYGPWADRQRDHLYKFFFPPNYQDLQVTPAPKPGERRIVHSFDVTWSTLSTATIDILFSKDKETNAVHINIGAGSYMEATLPWITLQDGFTTKITGQFLHVEATTSLQYRSLAEFESLHYNVKMHYPCRWNAHQDWSVNVIGSKATANIVFSHKDFFQNLIEDWANKARPDIFSFVPYTCKFSVLLKEFELILLSNEFNWIDCSSTNQENNHLAFCGDLFDLSFALPFDDFLPNTVPLRFWIHGEGMDLSMYLPEISTSRPIIMSMNENARILTRDGHVKKIDELYTKKWRRVCLKSAGWIDCWNVPILALSIQYVYHPIPPLGPDPQADITTPEKEELLLSPMRIPKIKKSPAITWTSSNGQQLFNPTSLPSDHVTVEIEIGSSVLLAYGSILKNFYYLKENIFGEDHAFTDMEKSNMKTHSQKVQNSNKSSKDDPNKSVSEVPSTIDVEEKPKRFDPRLYRPLDVTVILTIHDIQAHLMKNCNDTDPPCPIVLIERLGFEMKKRYFETQLQVLVSPSFIITTDTVARPSKEKHLKQGHLLLSALQIRGHAMFSNESRALDDETLEYAWMLEVQLGKFSGKLTLPQLTNIVLGLETLAYLSLDAENDLKSPKTIRYCHHGVSSNLCLHTKEETKYRCPSTEDIKYRMNRISVDAIDLYLLESGCALHTWISPIRFATCNLHGQQVKSGITALIPNILIRHFVSTSGHFSQNSGNSQSNTNTTGSGKSAKFQHQNSKSEDKKDDLNLLVKRDEASSNVIKTKKESEYGLNRKGSKEKDDSMGSQRRSRDEGHFRRDRDDIYASIHRNREVIEVNEPWLEVGCVALGPVIIEAATALPIPEHCLHLVQNNYLKCHDEKSKRLWFLWAVSTDVQRCGCVGGCMFFGSNRNGPKFFKPSAQDLPEAVNIARYHIHTNIKEFGFGQSLLHEGQLVFHTPPYSLQTISLQECYEYINKTSVRTSRQTIDSKSPLPQKHENILNQHKSDTSPNSTIVRDKSGRSTLERVKEKESGSPITAERRGRRFSYTNSRQPLVAHDVPYRLLDSSPKVQQQKLDSKLQRQESRPESSLSTPDTKIKALKIPHHKNSGSESRLTIDYFQEDDMDVSCDLSRSAPHSHPLQSDSQHSLGPKNSDDVTLRDVQRTISLTSENPSEAFFSADEDIHASRSSSLKTTDSVPLVIPKKRFASDLSIVGPTEGGKLSSHRSDYEIHTPEHRSLPARPQSTAELTEDERRVHNLATPLRKFSNISPRPEFRHFKPVYDVDQHDSSESQSLSSSSFISALSSQEDITLVNLHMQANRPIVDSPLLMASYLTHLAQVRCSNWSHCSLPLGSDAFSMPLFQKNEDGGLVYIGSKLVPHFDNYSHWREVRIVSRFEGNNTANSANIPPSCSSAPKPHPWDPMVMVRGDDKEKKREDDNHEFLGAFHGETATRSSLVIRLKGQIDIMLTPLLLEAQQRMIESMIPTLSALHPLSVINYLHSSCVSKVEAVNILKKDQTLSYWTRVHSNSKRSTTERNLQAGGPVMTDVYEESISTQLQGLIVLPKINVSLIQSSVVEEVISFSALDNVQELSCASLLAVCFEGVSTRFHLGKTTKASMHTVYTQPTIRSNAFKKGGIMRGTRALLAHLSSAARPDNAPGEAILIETSEKQLEELVITLDIGKVHAQLRRLKNEGYLIQESQTIITAIPSHRSRATFDCTKFPEEISDISGLGFIMFECGLEGISVKIVKRSQFEKSENAEENLKAEPEVGLTPEPTQISVTTNPALNLVHLLNEAGTSKAAEAIATTMKQITMKKPTTPKPVVSKDKTGPFDKIKEKETTPKIEKETTPKLKEKVPLKETISSDEPPKSNAESTENNNPTNSKDAGSQENDNGKLSSCIIDLKTVWFNFAAPPRAPITRKIDYSRLDWNLLSTAAPSITAWMNPSNRLAIKVVAIMRAMYLRRTAIITALMADSLEEQNTLRPAKTRYPAKFTPLAKTLQEDPSCKLFTILQKYVMSKGIDEIEEVLKQKYLPHLSTLRQGVIVLSRQWKSVLYNPMLFEHQYKGKLARPINVTFSIPQIDDDGDDIDEENTDTLYPGGVIIDQNPLVADEENESTLLLKQHASHHVIQMPEDVATNIHITKLAESVNSTPSTANSSKRKKALGKIIPPAAPPSRTSTQMFPNISGFVDKQDPNIEYGELRSGTSLPSVASSNESPDKSVSPGPQNLKEDLYSWMAKQQTSSNKNGKRDEKNSDIRSITPVKASVHPLNNCMQDSVRLLDAHLIFEPLLTCLGVMPTQMINNVSNKDVTSLENLGTNLSLVCSFETMRIDIVVSEAGDKKPKTKISKKANGKFSVPLGNDTPAFLCERVGIELEVLKMTDGLNEEPKQLYLSRGQLKKHTSTVINFSLNVRYISQQVNMPLLRLLHQITNMYQNVKEAQNEMKEQPDGKRSGPLKDESSLASEMNDATLIGSMHDTPLESTIFDYSDERYDKFNEAFPIGHSVSRTKMPPLGPLIPLTPSPNSRRPQSFAQKLRSTGKTVKGKLGYINLNETIPTPVKSSPTASTFDQAFQRALLEPKQSMTGGISNTFGGPLVNEAFADLMGTFENSSYNVPIGVPTTPRCWQTIDHLLQLYATMPETKTVTHRVSISPDAMEHLKANKKYNLLHETSRQTNRDDDEGGSETPLPNVGVVQERTRLMIFGVAKIHKTRLLATLSGLKLEAEITSLHSSTTWRKKLRPASLECSLTGQVGKAMIVLLEGVAPNQQTVVKVTVGKSQTLYSSVTKRSKDKNNGLLTIGAIYIDIPQHPVALHGMMTRSSKQLSSTLQELRVTRTSARLSRQNEEPESPLHSKDSKDRIPTAHSQKPRRPPPPMISKTAQANVRSGLLQPLVMQFNVFFQSLSMTAALLPSLQAQYKMDNVTSKGVTGSKANFTIDLPSQSLSFITKITAQETHLPPQASIPLPQVHVRADYVPEGDKGVGTAPQDTPIDGVVLRQGGYLSASAEIGEFERCLTTDLLNHLVFVQKVFMKEVNEVVQKIYGGEKPVPLWLEESEENVPSSLKHILFSLNIKMKRIQLTATTPCSSAVRFETGAIDFHLSNRVKNIAEGSNTKLFGKAQIDLNLSLGQIIKNAIFDEAEPEFQQYAFFNTTIGFRNAFQDEMLNDDRELVLITLKRPLIYFQPIAIDKAILVWLNYKTAYEYWAEKRANLNKEVLTATQQVFEKVPFSNLGATNLSTLFLQLTVEDMGICMPLNPPPLNNTWGTRSIIQDFEQKGAVVITLENTIISACSSGSLVSKGKFVGLCLRFADDFDASLDDWKPNMNDDNMMNLCVVSEGTYEVCSRTIAAKLMENAKWFLNVKWQMEGVDIHLDVNIGKQLSALGHTLTMLAGNEDDEEPVTLDSPDSEDADTSYAGKVSQDVLPRTRKALETLPSFLFDPSLDSKKRSLLMENEINEQTKIVSDLRSLGASSNTVAHEERRLEELQGLCYKYFRKDMIQKWKRPAVRRSMLKSANRSKSYVEPSPTHDSGELDSINLDTIHSANECGSSTHGSPVSNTSSSLKMKIPTTRVQFNDAMRQSSLPSADSEVSFSESGPEWPSMTSIREPPHMLQIDGEDVELRKKSPQVHPQKQQEPNIDFELDIKVLVNSGKCVLHTKETGEEKLSSTNSSTNIRHHRRERSIGTDYGSPVPTRRSKEKARLKYPPPGALVDLTIFHIPGLDVKLHYQSKTLPDETSPRMSTVDPFGMPMATRRLGSKRASLFAWIVLQSIPEETIISPHILEFLEQTLEPIPNSQFAVPSNPVNLGMLEHNYVVYASFPVDVIVYFHMKPSTFRFSCLPVSRVECMLQLPSLDIIFSSKRQEENTSNEIDSKSATGGLSVTGCLADFNVYIFHPYGGKKTNTKESQPFSPLSDSERKDSLSINVEFVKFHITRSRKLNFDSNLQRKANEQATSRATIRFNTIVDIGSASFKYDMRRLTEILAFPKAWYRRNIMRRIFLGDLSVQQTNLNEQESPTNADDSNRSSYNRSPNEKSPLLMTREKLRLNLENEMGAGGSSKGTQSKPVGKETPSPEGYQYTSWETTVLFALNFTKLNVQMNMGNVMGNVVWLTKAFRSDGSLSIGSTGHKNLYIGIGLGGSALDAKGGIVGGTIEISKIDTYFHIREEPNMEPNHKLGLKFRALELKFDYMGTSVLMTRISDFNSALRDEWKRSKGRVYPAKRPVIILIHGDLSWDQLQIMISKSTTADILKMFYKLEDFFSQQFKSSKRVFSSLEPKLQMGARPTGTSMRRKQLKKKIASSAQGDENIHLSFDARHHRHWQDPLNKAIGLCLSTLKYPLPKTGIVLGGTMELHGKNISLACFHGINFKSKSWALFSLREPCINFATEAQQLEKMGDFHVNQTLTFGLGMDSQAVPQHHSMATVVRMSRNVIFPPQFKTLQEWFNYAFSNSEIDAVDRFPVLERDIREPNTNSIERARSSVPVSSNTKLQEHNHNREVIFALPSLQLHFKTDHMQPTTPDVTQEKPTVECSFITEFEDHIFVTVDADAFFFLHDLITSYLKEKEKVISSHSARAGSPNLNTISSSNTAKESANNLDKSAITGSVSSLMTNDSNTSLNVATLTASGSSKNLNVLSGSSSTANVNNPEDLRHLVGNKKINSSKAEKEKEKQDKDNKVDLEAFMRMDWRHFNCKTWHLEPTVRLLSWAGKSIEPYGIDYILNKLGFSHARTTIPKWLQRGFMDPLDKLQSLMLLQLLLMVEENRNIEPTTNSDGTSEDK